MKTQQHRMTFLDKNDPTDEFAVAVSVEHTERAQTHHLVECLIMFAEKLSGETFERVQHAGTEVQQS